MLDKDWLNEERDWIEDSVAADESAELVALKPFSMELMAEEEEFVDGSSADGLANDL